MFSRLPWALRAAVDGVVMGGHLERGRWNPLDRAQGIFYSCQVRDEDANY